MDELRQLSKNIILAAVLVNPTEFRYVVSNNTITLWRGETEALTTVNTDDFQQVAIVVHEETEEYLWKITVTSGECIMLPINNYISGNDELLQHFFSLEDFDLFSFTEITDGNCSLDIVKKENVLWQRVN